MVAVVEEPYEGEKQRVIRPASEEEEMRVESPGDAYIGEASPLASAPPSREGDATRLVLRQTPSATASRPAHPLSTLAMAPLGLTLSLATLALIFLSVHAQDEPARLLVEKRILNKYLVEDKDIVIHYHIFNVGQSPALDVTVTDSSLPPEYFALASGISSFKVPRLAPGANITHTVVFRPKTGVWGPFNFTSAVVTYKTSEQAAAVQVGSTSEPGEGYIVTLREFERKFSSHLLDWLAFAAMVLPSLLIPYVLWYQSKRRYERVGSSKHLNKSVKSQ